MHAKYDQTFRPVVLTLNTPEDCALIAGLLGPLSAWTASRIVAGGDSDPIDIQPTYDTLKKAAEDGGVDMEKVNRRVVLWRKGFDMRDES